MNYLCILIFVFGIVSSPLVSDDLPAQSMTFSETVAHNALPMAMAIALPIVSRFAVDRAFGQPHYRAHIIILALSSAILTWRNDFSLQGSLIFSSLIGLSTHAFLGEKITAGIDAVVAGGGSSAMLALLFLNNLLKSTAYAFSWNPFYQQIIIINESGQPLTLLADTPCDGSDGVWRMSYDVSASKEPQYIVLSSWHFDAAKKDRFQQEKLCFYRSRIPNDNRWLPYPHVDHFRFVIVDPVTKKSKADSCLLPLKPAGVLHAYPVYIVRKNSSNLEVYLKHYVYGILKPIVTLPPLNIFLESSLAEQRIEPVRLCKP